MMVTNNNASKELERCVIKSKWPKLVIITTLTTNTHHWIIQPRREGIQLPG